MTAVSVFWVLMFDTVLCMIEIPKMLHGKLYREVWTFSILLGLGTVLAILKSLNVEIPNPSDWVAWVYSPLREGLKSFMKG